MTTAPTSLSTCAGFTVASLDGEIDITNSVELETELSYAVPNDAQGLILDMTQVSFIDSSGIRTLFDLASRLHHHQQELRIVLPATSALRRTIGLLQIPAVIPVFDDLVEAATEA